MCNTGYYDHFLVPAEEVSLGQWGAPAAHGWVRQRRYIYILNTPPSEPADALSITRGILYGLICLTLTVVHYEYVIFCPGSEPSSQGHCYGVERAHSSILCCFHAGPRSDNYIRSLDWRFSKRPSIEEFQSGVQNSYFHSEVSNNLQTMNPL